MKKLAVQASAASILQVRELVGFIWADSPSQWFRSAPEWVRTTWNIGSLVLIAHALLACSHSEPGIEVRTVEVPVPVRCVDPASIPAEPDKVGDQLTGEARHDLSIVAESALELRKWGQHLNALLVGCTLSE